METKTFIMKNTFNKITNSLEWKIISEMTKPKIILTALAFNVGALLSMYGALEVMFLLYYKF